MKLILIITTVIIFTLGLSTIQDVAGIDMAKIDMFELCTDYGTIDFQNGVCTLTKDVNKTINIGTTLAAHSTDIPIDWKDKKFDGVYEFVKSHPNDRKEWDYFKFNKFTVDGNGHKIIIPNEECVNGNWAAVTAKNNHRQADSLILKNIHIDGSDWNCKSTNAGNSLIHLYGIYANGGLTVIDSEIHGTTPLGIVLSSGQLILKDSFIHDVKLNSNGNSFGISVHSRNLGDTSIIENNKISNTVIGISGEDLDVIGNEISDNQVGVQTSKKGTISDNVFKNNKIAIDSSAQIISNNEFINNDKNSSDKQNTWIHDLSETEIPAIEPPMLPKLAPFVDPMKDPQSYIDRYNNELSYKEWFDENYPDYTIYEAVGFDEFVNYPVKMDIILQENNFDFGEPITFEVWAEPAVPNTPLTISIGHDIFYVQGNQLIPKSDDTNENKMMTTMITKFSDYGVFEEFGKIFFVIYPKNIPYGNYLMKVELGSNDVLLGQSFQKFSITNNSDSIGHQYLEKYFPNYLDVGTSVEIIENSNVRLNLEYGQYSLSSCYDSECKIQLSKQYRFEGDIYTLELHEFETQRDAKRYGASSFHWDGTPSSKGNKDPVINTSLINDQSKQCFTFDGGYYSANGVDGLLKCTIGTFVVEVANTNEISQDLVFAMIEKIESNIDPKKLEKHELVTSESKKSNQICGEGTVLVDNTCVVDSTISMEEKQVNSDDNSGGGCLIATATYGSELAPEVQKLRELRDNSILSTISGTSFMSTFNEIYYSFSPVIADYERENPVFKEMVKVAITPMMSSISILNYVDMDSESSVLGYGISLIILNGLMYVGIPIAGIVVIRKRF